ncbi:MAG: TolC family protein [Reichenbachiella sp.]
MKKTTYVHTIVRSMLSFVVIACFFGRAAAQEVKNLTLDEAVAEVLNNNWSLRMGQAQVQMSQADLTSANSAFLPTVSLSETYTTTNDPMMAFGTKLGQSAITAEDFNPDLLNHPDAIDNFATRLEVSQPLFNLDGLYGRQAAKAATEAAGKHQSWSQEMIVLQTKGLYHNIALAKKGQETIHQAVISAEENYKTAKNLFDQGLITNADLMGAELRFTQVKSQALQAKHYVADLNQRFLQLLGTDENIIINPTDTLQIREIDMAAIATMTSMDERADLQSMEIAVRASELNMKSQKSGFVPRVNAFGSYGLNDTQAFGNQSDNYLLGVQMKWDLFQGSKQIGKVQRSKYENELATLAYEEKQSSVKRDIMRLKNDLLLAQEQVVLAKLGAKQAQEVYKIRSNRYVEGLEKTSDLLMDESNYLNKQLDLLRAKNNYIQVLFRLETELSQDLTTIN